MSSGWVCWGTVRGTQTPAALSSTRAVAAMPGRPSSQTSPTLSQRGSSPPAASPSSGTPATHQQGDQTSDTCRKIMEETITPLFICVCILTVLICFCQISISIQVRHQDYVLDSSLCFPLVLNLEHFEK